jgi:hypothetical protein
VHLAICDLLISTLNSKAVQRLCNTTVFCVPALSIKV